MRTTTFISRMALAVSFMVLALLTGATALAQDAPHLVVNTAHLNVRTGPGVSHSIIDDVPGGAVLPVLMRAANLTWYRVESPVGTGYVNSRYTVKRGDFSGVGWEGAPDNLTTGTGPVAWMDARVIVNTAYLNVRSGPGVGYAVVTVVPGGTELAVTQISNDGNWYEVETAAGRGWLRHSYTESRAAITMMCRRRAVSSHIYSVSDSAILAGAPHLVINTAYLNIRSGPGMSNSTLMVAPGGSRLLVTGRAAGTSWYEIETGSGPGWVNARYTAARGDFSRLATISSGLTGSQPRGIVNVAALNVRAGPGTSYPKLGAVVGGTTQRLTGVSGDGMWVRAETNAANGWLYASMVVTRGNVSQLPIVG